VAERSGDTAFRMVGCAQKRRGASLPAAVQKSVVAAQAALGSFRVYPWFKLLFANRSTAGHLLQLFRITSTLHRDLASAEPRPMNRLVRHIAILHPGTARGSFAGPRRKYLVFAGVHWHGAAPTTAMTPHRHSGTARRQKPVDWMEKVSDEQYQA